MSIPSNSLFDANGKIKKEFIGSAITRSATIKIAASNATEQSKSAADYVCDGVNDEEEIHAAIALLGEVGGRIELSEGMFTCDTLSITGNVSISGQGDATIINCMEAFDVDENSICSISACTIDSDITNNGESKLMNCSLPYGVATNNGTIKMLFCKTQMIINNGTLEMLFCKTQAITNNSTLKAYGCETTNNTIAITCASTSILNLNGHKVAGSTAIHGRGDIRLTNCDITGTTYGLRVLTDAKCIVTGSTINIVYASTSTIKPSTADLLNQLNNITTLTLT